MPVSVLVKAVLWSTLASGNLLAAAVAYIEGAKFVLGVTHKGARFAVC